jgi:pilus assembly protein Flp/PilA
VDPLRGGVWDSTKHLVVPGNDADIVILSLKLGELDQSDRKLRPVHHAWPKKSGLRREKSKMIMRKFVRDESGATAIEYGLIAACIAIAIIVAAQGVGTQLNATFDKVKTELGNANG